MDPEEFYALGEGYEETENADIQGEEPLDGTPNTPNLDSESQPDEALPIDGDAGNQQANDEENLTPPSPFEGFTQEQIKQKIAEINSNRQQNVQNPPEFNNPVFQNALGHANPFTGRIIQSFEDFKEYQQEYDFRNMVSKMQSGQVTRSEFSEFLKSAVQQMPEIKAAEEAKQQANAIAEQTKRKEGEMRLQADIDKFNAGMPSCGIKSINDVYKDDAVLKNISRGLPFADAYKLAHYDDIVNSKIAAVQQAAVTNQQNKSHLTTTGGGAAAETVIVPDDVKAGYKEFFPDWSDKQIAEDWAKRRND